LVNRLFDVYLAGSDTFKFEEGVMYIRNDLIFIGAPGNKFVTRFSTVSDETTTSMLAVSTILKI